MLNLRSSLFLALLLPSVLSYPTQHPLSPPLVATAPVNYTSYELRRYGISNSHDLIHMINTLNKNNIDIWQLTPTHMDVHMDTSNTPVILAQHTYTTLPHSFPYNYNYTYSQGLHLAPDVTSLQNSSFHGAFHTYEEIDAFVVALAQTYPKLVEVVLLGKSSEDRDVFAIRIGKRGSGRRKHKHRKGVQVEGVGRGGGGRGRGGGWGRGRTGRGGYPHDSVNFSAFFRRIRAIFMWFRGLWGSKQANAPRSARELYVNDSSLHGAARPVKDRIVIQGAQHAREWIATSTALYLAHALVAPRKEHGSLRHLLDDNDFTIIPVPNPDGYAYTWTTDRLWYKNRMKVRPNTNAPIPSDDCRGVDMNRNWGYEWNSSAGPEDPCSHWYPGAYPFEAPEVTAIANYVRRTPKIKAFLDLRSYGQKLMYPYSYTCDQVPPHAEDIIEAALGATKALREVHNMAYTSGASCELLYPAPGNVIDWMYGEAKVKYAYSLMLRDTGTYGFLLPPRWIQPVGEETAAAVSSLAKFIEDVE